MGLMECLKSWNQAQYDKRRSKIQKKYNKVQDWKTPAWTKKLFAKIWNRLDGDVQKKLYKIIKQTINQFDEDFAKVILKYLVTATVLRFNLKN